VNDKFSQTESVPVTIVKTRLLVLIFILLLPIIVVAQDDDDWPSLSYLRHDYRDSTVVARVQVDKAEVVNTIGGYEDWHLAGRIVESFKGKFRKDATIDFYHGAEKGFQQKAFLGDKLIFLHRNFAEKEKRWVLAVIENSTLPYTGDRGQKLRIIRRQARSKALRRRKA
jgi:hypothetical protein